MRVIRLKEVAKILGISRETLYRWRKMPGFPKTVELSYNSKGILDTDLERWVQNQRTPLDPID